MKDEIFFYTSIKPPPQNEFQGTSGETLKWTGFESQWHWKCTLSNLSLGLYNWDLVYQKVGGVVLRNGNTFPLVTVIIDTDSVRVDVVVGGMTI